MAGREIRNMLYFIAILYSSAMGIKSILSGLGIDQLTLPHPSCGDASYAWPVLLRDAAVAV